MLLATIAHKTGRAEPNGRRALAILDLGIVIGLAVICYQPVFKIAYLFNTGTLVTALIFLGYLTPFLATGSLALHALVRRGDEK